MVSLTYASIGAALAAMAALHGPADALDQKLYGINYDLRQGPDWDPSKCKSAETIASDLKVLSAITKRVRTYALSDCDVRPVLTTAKALGMTVWLGVWVASDPSIYKNEVAVAEKLLTEGLIDSNVVGFNVGSEAVYREDITAEEAVNYITDFKKWLKTNSLDIPVAVTDIIDTMLAHPEIVEAGDVVTINQFPFWEKISADKAVAQFKTRIQPLLELAGDKQVIISETGWSTGGKNENASDATAAGGARYLHDFFQLATASKWQYYYFQGFDSEYKSKLPGEEDTVESYFGLFHSTGEMKDEYKNIKFGDLTTVPVDTAKSGSASDETGTASSESSGASAASKTEGETGATESGPGTVSASSADGATSPSGSTTSSTNSSKNSTSPTKKPASAASSLLATGLSAGIVLASVLLASL